MDFHGFPKDFPKISFGYRSFSRWIPWRFLKKTARKWQGMQTEIARVMSWTGAAEAAVVYLPCEKDWERVRKTQKEIERASMNCAPWVGRGPWKHHRNCMQFSFNSSSVVSLQTRLGPRSWKNSLPWLTVLSQSRWLRTLQSLSASVASSLLLPRAKMFFK